jgi:predicted acylesterase/phospholipase RssA
MSATFEKTAWSKAPRAQRSIAVLGCPRMLAVGSGGNKFIELLAAAHELRAATGKDWEVLAGISAGALLCALISMIPLNDAGAFERDLTRAREKFVDSASASPFRPWIPLGAFASALFAFIFHKPSVFKGNGKFVRREFNNARFRVSGRRLMVGIFDQTSQQYRTIDSRWHSERDIVRAIAASCAVPVVVPGIQFQGHLCRDGGVVHTLPIKEIFAFVKRHQGKSRVHVDLLVSDGLRMAPQPRDKPNITQAMLDVCTSLVWLNLQRDLRQLVKTLLVPQKAKAAEVEAALNRVRSGEQRNFDMPWGTMRIVSPVDLNPRRAPRTSFRVPHKDTAEALLERGTKAAQAALKKNKL